MMPERASRTFICSVLFLDIVEYSRKPVAEQIRLKDRFNGLIASAIREIPAADRIILDTGDGVAISFLGDPEDALFVAMSLRDAFSPDSEQPPEVPARIGINLGPVRLVRDLNGRPNIIGDGINVAQRVMGFAAAGQILVSRSYFEIVSHISEGYTKLFTYEGSRTDKHVREHEIYSIGYPTAASRIKSPAERARRGAGDALARSTTGNATAARALFHVEKWLGNRSLAYGTAAFSALAFLMALVTSFIGEAPQAQPSQHAESGNTRLAGTAVRQQRPASAGASTATSGTSSPQNPPDKAKTTAAQQDNSSEGTSAGEDVTTSDATPEPKRRKLRLPFFRPKNDDETAAAATQQPPSSEDGFTDEPDTGAEPTAPATATQADIEVAANNITDSEETTTSALGAEQPTTATSGRAFVALAISPWGEVFVDGKAVGVSPPLNEVELAPGRRVIEIRNGDFPPYRQQVELKARQKIKIRYKFN